MTRINDIRKRHCKAETKTGGRCPNAASASGYCFTHDPTRGGERARARKLGGAHRRIAHAGDADALPKQVRTLPDVLSVLDYALAEALPLENGVQRGRLIVSIAHAFIEAIKTGELEARLDALERALKLRGENEK